MSTELSDLLRRLRQAAGLSGERLAFRARMSQSKISRIESGKVVPSVEDVERLAAALEVTGETGRELLALARRGVEVEHASWRDIGETGAWRKQAELRRIAESCVVQRFFLPAGPGALLQTPEYAAAALAPAVGSDPPRDVRRAVAARIERQRVLLDEQRRFVFLLTEQAVRWRRAAEPVLAEQRRHLADLADRPNVEVAVLPLETPVAGPPLNTFVVYDHRLVIAELFSGEVVFRNHREIAHHLDLFAFFHDRALTGGDAQRFLREGAW